MWILPLHLIKCLYLQVESTTILLNGANDICDRANNFFVILLTPNCSTGDYQIQYSDLISVNKKKSNTNRFSSESHDIKYLTSSDTRLILNDRWKVSKNIPLQLNIKKLSKLRKNVHSWSHTIIPHGFFSYTTLVVED